jgi:hypothetical protein
VPEPPRPEKRWRPAPREDAGPLGRRFLTLIAVVAAAEVLLLLWWLLGAALDPQAPSDIPAAGRSEPAPSPSR